MGIGQEWPAPMVELCISGAAVLLTGNGLPLLTANRFGQGHVYVLAVPTGAVTYHCLISGFVNRGVGAITKPPLELVCSFSQAEL